MEVTTDVIIAGGGLAGLTSAIHLSRNGLKVVIIEKEEFPRHKVCGEYISNEVIPYLESLSANPSVLGPSLINRFLISSSTGKFVEVELPLGGFGISRYALDKFLLEKALENGCQLIQDTVSTISYSQTIFHVKTSSGLEIKGHYALGAFGKRSSLDIKMNRKFISKKSPWLAIKAHYHGIFPDNLVALHNFKGGYCGVSKIENGIINICYLVDYESFKKFKNPLSFQRSVMYGNPLLKTLFENSSMLFEQPLTISQVSFKKKNCVDDHILMIGDSAGLIHPLCGNGMALAIHSAKLASELIVKSYASNDNNHEKTEAEYSKAWNRHFSKRLQTGKLIAEVFKNEWVSENLIAGFTRLSFILPNVINQTHGKYLSAAE